nr:hypothetical protein BaRGS_011440 [Batillaria attramentaria]
MTLCSQYTLKFTLRDVTDPVTGHVSLTMVPSDLYIHNELFFDGLENVVLTFVIPISFLITVTIATALTVPPPEE